jgi:RNA polymerase sigma-70 factor, ECF subfamily
MDERDLILKAQRGDREAFGLLVRSYQARLRAFVARSVHRAEDVFDIVQDAFLDALKNLHRFDPGQELGPWLRACCRNRMLNFFRARRVRQTAAVALVDQALEEQWMAHEVALDEVSDEVRALQKCVDQLEGSQRELLDFRYKRNVPVHDLARRLRRSAAALSMTLFRIRAALQKCMGRRLEAIEP